MGTDYDKLCPKRKMLQSFTPLAARLVVAEDELAPLPPPPDDDAELDNNEDPLLSTGGEVLV